MTDPLPEEKQLERKPSPAKPSVNSWNSTQLLGESQEARIEHGGEVYRLLRTRNDKLILVK